MTTLISRTPKVSCARQDYGEGSAERDRARNLLPTAIIQSSMVYLAFVAGCRYLRLYKSPGLRRRQSSPSDSMLVDMSPDVQQSRLDIPLVLLAHDISRIAPLLALITVSALQDPRYTSWVVGTYRHAAFNH